jgi:hypothetical protein
MPTCAAAISAPATIVVPVATPVAAIAAITILRTGSPALGPVPTPLIGACARLIIIPTAETVPVSTPTAAVPGAGTVLTPVVRHGPSFSFVGRRS